jgi:hypothetical protein
MVERPDLGERSIIINCPTIDDSERRDEDEFWAAFEASRAAILGSLLNAVSEALRNRDTVVLERKPRMADFATWVTAAEPALGWKAGTFLSTYNANQEHMIDEVLQSDAVSAAVLAFMEDRSDWEGTATEFLNILNVQVGDRVGKSKGWPMRPNTLSNKLKRSTTYLRKKSIYVERGREGNKRNRFITITKTPPARAERVGKTPSAPSAPSAAPKNQKVAADDAADDHLHADNVRQNTVRSNSLKSNKETDADVAGDLLPTSLNGEGDDDYEAEEREAIQNEPDADGGLSWRSE